jgi:hypothetical protein
MANVNVNCNRNIFNRIRMLTGLPDLDPLVRGTDPDPSLSHKGVKRTEIRLAKKFLAKKIIF